MSASTVDLPTVSTTVVEAGVDVLCLDSSNITPDQWLLIAESIFTLRSGYDGIVVSHGTDTLETPSRNFTMGTNATRIMRSLVATCTTV